MSTISITYTCKYCISFAPNYVFTICGICYNTQTQRPIKKIIKGGSIGYNIKGRFYTLAALKKQLTKIKKGEYIPF